MKGKGTSFPDREQHLQRPRAGVGGGSKQHRELNGGHWSWTTQWSSEWEGSRSRPHVIFYTFVYILFFIRREMGSL